MSAATENPRRRLVGAVLCVSAATLAATAEAADLTVVITGMRSADGNVHISIYDRPETFPKSKGMLREQVVKAKAPIVEVTFSGLTPGTYAVAAFHDENGNRNFDQGLFGMPLEDYGFSNDATVFLSPPGFDAAAFTVAGDGAHVTVRMKR